MKMVLVFDTDDKDGMQTSMKMMQTILRDYADRGHYETDPRFGKIEFIKMLKDFDAFSQLPNTERNAEDAEYAPGLVRLRNLKEFADHVWSEKKNSSYYKPKWLKR